MKVILLAFLVLILMIFAVGAWDDSNRNDAISRNFIGMFHAQRTGFRVISDDVTNYIESCCEGRQQAIDLLRINGFEIHENPRPDPEKLKMSIKEAGFDHDETIYARRSAGISRFWRFSTYYEVTLYIKKDNFVHAYAVVKTDYL